MRVVSTSLFNIKEFPAHLIYELVSRFHDDMSRYFPTGWTNMYHFLKMLEITFGFLFHFFQKMLKMSIFIRHFRTRTMRSVPFPIWYQAHEECQLNIPRIFKHMLHSTHIWLNRCCEIRWFSRFFLDMKTFTFNALFSAHQFLRTNLNNLQHIMLIRSITKLNSLSHNEFYIQ